ncbi:MAG: hypothetical protein JRJ85_26995 [Deltaproteobacteria bacterium]|nr:hypothetical protein [Deltaproteobacteria bacterium]
MQTYTNSLQMVFALFSGLMGILVLWYAYRRHSSVPPDFPAEERQEQRCQAINIRLDLSTKLFDVGLIFLGVLWGLILTEQIMIKLWLWTDVVLFINSNILLLFSLLTHLLYKRRVSTILWDISPLQPSILSKHIDYLFNVQWMFFFASLIAGFFTIISVKIIGGE